MLPKRLYYTAQDYYYIMKYCIKQKSYRLVAVVECRPLQPPGK